MCGRAAAASLTGRYLCPNEAAFEVALRDATFPVCEPHLLGTVSDLTEQGEIVRVARIKGGVR